MQVKATVGIDFGTRNTKLAYSVFGERYVEPIIFEHGLPSAYYPDYCLPSVADFDDRGRLLLGVDAARRLADESYDAGVRHIKMMLAGAYADEFRDEDDWNRYQQQFRKRWVGKKVLRPDILTAMYLFYAMQQARAVLTKKYPPQQHELELEFRIGMPIHHLKMHEVRPAFEKVIAVTQKLDEEYGIRKVECAAGFLQETVQRPFGRESHAKCELVSWEKMIEFAESLWPSAEYDEKADHTRAFFVPETMAQIASYRFSPARKSGIHVMVDVGAGTTDVCVLNLRNVKTKWEVLDCYAWRNIPGAASQIERVVARYLHAAGEKPTPAAVLQSIIHIKRGSRLGRSVKKEVCQLWHQAEPVYREGYEYGLRAERMTMDDWCGDSVLVLLGGGGALIPFVHEQFREAPICAQSGLEWGPYSVDNIPTPERHYPPESAAPPFGRMAVAYGLASHELLKFDLTPPFDPPPQRPTRQCGEYDGDILLPTSSWV